MSFGILILINYILLFNIINYCVAFFVHSARAKMKTCVRIRIAVRLTDM